MNQQPDPGNNTLEYFATLKAKSHSSTKAQQLASPDKLVQLIEQGRITVAETPSPIQVTQNDSNPEPRNLENYMLTNQSHSKFVKQVSKDRKRLQKQREDWIHQQQENELKLKQENEQRERREKEEKEARKKVDLEQRLAELQKRRIQHKLEQAKQNKQLQSVKNSKTLFQKFEEKYMQHEVKSLEEKKEKLARIRQLHRPITKEEIQQHAQKVSELREQIDAQKERPPLSPNKIDFYQSAWYKKTRQEVRGDESPDTKLKNLSKIKEYGSYVKENFKPSIDESLQEQIKIKTHHVTIPHVNAQEQRKIGHQYLKYVKENKPAIPRKRKTSGSMADLTSSQVKFPNYLQELKQNHPPVDEAKILQKALQKKETKGKLILDYAQKLETKAQQVKQLARANGATDDQSDDMMMQAIEAKLALLR